jgi:biotin carboxyl carrier protein
MRFVARMMHGDEPRDVDVEVFRHGAAYRVRVGERWVEADIVSAGPFVRSLRLDDGTQLSLTHHRDGTTHEISLGGANITVDIIDPLAAKRRGREDDIGSSGVVKALMPGRVVRVLVAQGEAVRKGAGLLILEAMKMENEITAPADGTVDTLFVEAGQTVEAGAELLHISVTV